MKIVAVIPAYNERGEIEAVVRAVQKYCDAVIVVDDGSSDGMRFVVDELGVNFVRHPVNKGQGAATRTGIKLALELGADIVITLDGDGQHDPDQIPQLLNRMRETNADVVVGSRFLSKVDE